MFRMRDVASSCHDSTGCSSAHDGQVTEQQILADDHNPKAALQPLTWGILLHSGEVN